MTDVAADPPLAADENTVATPRRLRHGAVVAMVVLLVAGTAAFVALRRTEPRAAEPTAPIRLEPLGSVGIDLNPGAVGIGVTIAIHAMAPVTLLDVRPYHTSQGVDVVVRAVFDGGPGDVSPSGHLNAAIVPLDTCADGWPLPGYGPSYPVPGLSLASDDAVAFAWYARSDHLGVATLSGWRITYRTARGKVHTAVSRDGVFNLTTVPRGDGPAACNHPVAESGWAQRLPDFPT